MAVAVTTPTATEAAAGAVTVATAFTSQGSRRTSSSCRQRMQLRTPPLRGPQAPPLSRDTQKNTTTRRRPSGSDGTGTAATAKDPPPTHIPSTTTGGRGKEIKEVPAREDCLMATERGERLATGRGGSRHRPRVAGQASSSCSFFFFFFFFCLPPLRTAPQHTRLEAVAGRETRKKGKKRYTASALTASGRLAVGGIGRDGRGKQFHWRMTGPTLRAAVRGRPESSTSAWGVCWRTNLAAGCDDEVSVSPRRSPSMTGVWLCVRRSEGVQLHQCPPSWLAGQPQAVEVCPRWTRPLPVNHLLPPTGGGGGGGVVLPVGDGRQRGRERSGIQRVVGGQGATWGRAGGVGVPTGLCGTSRGHRLGAEMKGGRAPCNAHDDGVRWSRPRQRRLQSELSRKDGGRRVTGGVPLGQRGDTSVV